MVKRGSKTEALVTMGPSAVGRAAKISKQLASRKLRQGKTPDEINLEADRRRRMLASRNGSNGSEGNDGNRETFTEAQRRKESALADLRELEYRQKRGELASVVDLNSWFGGQIIKARDRLLRLPAELRERLGMMSGPECEQLLDRELRDILADLKKYGESTRPKRRRS